MGFDHHHFPTFGKVGRAIGQLAGWIRRVVLRERGLIRLGLYFLLFVSLAYMISDRYLEATYGMTAMPAFWRVGNQMPRPYTVPEPGVMGAIHWAARFILGGTAGEMAPVIVAICLAGLVFSTRAYEGESGGRWWSNGRALPRAVVTAGSLDPLPPEPPAPPPTRHPLDPDPDDPPLEPLWPNRSHPSR